MARVDRHTRLVGWLKVALPLTALAILSTLFLVARRIDPEAALPYAEVDVRFSERPEGSTSKLSTVGDGWRILRRLLRLFRDWRPLLTFSVAGLLTILVAVVVLIPVLVDYAETGLVARQPTLIVAGAAIALGFGLVATGMILDRITRLRLEMARLLYLALPSSSPHGGGPPP